jgi:hypothetical protein
MGRGKRGGKVFEKTVERPIQCGWPRDQNIVGTFPSAKGQNGRSRGAQAPFGPVALDRATDLSAGGETDSQAAGLSPFFRGGACLEHQSGCRLAYAALSAQEIGSVLQAVGP